jgi:predicted DNA-binding transcriptional regulator YafY
LAALALGARMVQGWSDPTLGQAAERALLKIEAVLPASLQASLAQQALMVPDFHVPAGMVQPLGILRQAIGESRKVVFSYTRADGSSSMRRVWPLGLFFWGKTWTLGAWCELRESFRSFRPDRMAELRLDAETFDARQGSLLAEYIRVVSAD